MKQQQFLHVLERDEAEAKWRAVVSAAPLGREAVPLACALGRVLAEDVRAPIDVPGFDRANMDGFALRAADTFGASEENPKQLKLNGEVLATGVAPQQEVQPGTATAIATGGVLPRGADAVLPVEQSEISAEGALLAYAARVPGAAISFAGADMGRGETALYAGTKLGSRETGVLAALGCAQVPVYVRPRVAIISTGDEIVQPGAPLKTGFVYDSNGRILADAVRELGGAVIPFGAVPDELPALQNSLQRALASADVVLLSGGSSKGERDLNIKAVSKLSPGVIVHGVALKPGKPICLAAHKPDENSPAKAVVVLPGFPTSAVFTFHEFVAPLLRAQAGLPPLRRESTSAQLALPVQSERGRLEYLLVGLAPGEGGGANSTLSAWPMGKGSGSVTAFSRADGFIRIPRNTEQLPARAAVDVVRLSNAPPADLVVIGSHCAGLDELASRLSQQGFRVKVMAVGSRAGLSAAIRGECDCAPIHLYDAESGKYNSPFVQPGLRLLRGYPRMQGVVTRADETRETAALLADPKLRMVNRNQGAGTRALLDELLGARRPPGYAVAPRSHYAVAAAVAQGRADWGVTIEAVAREAGLRFRPLRAEQYDFLVPETRWQRPAVAALRALLAERNAN